MGIEFLLAVAALLVGYLIGRRNGYAAASDEAEDELVDYERRVQTLRDENLRLRLEMKLAIKPREILDRGLAVRSPRVQPWPGTPMPRTNPPGDRP